MLGQLKTYLEFGNLFCGVEHALKDNQNILYTTVLKKTKKELDIETCFNDASFENLAAKLPKKQHLFLVINNDHVLTKKIESQQTEISKLVYSAFPNINLEDFYYEVISQGNVHFVSLCRRAYVEELISNYEHLKFYVTGISLGNLIASSISEFVNSKYVLTSNSIISIENKTIVSISKVETLDLTEYDINGLQVKNTHLLSISGALASVLNHFKSETNFNLLKQSLKNDYKQSRFYMLFLKFGLLSILTILLINFFVFNHYFNAVNRLQQTSQINQTTKQNMLELNERVVKSQKMVEDMLQSSSSKSSFYINTIIQGLPNFLLLTELDYQPILKRIKSGQAIETNNNTILISGQSNNSEQFSKWLTSLEAQNWIHQVEILSYEDISKSISNFNIKVTIIHD